MKLGIGCGLLCVVFVLLWMLVFWISFAVGLLCVVFVLLWIFVFGFVLLWVSIFEARF